MALGCTTYFGLKMIGPVLPEITRLDLNYANKDWN